MLSVQNFFLAMMLETKVWSMHTNLNWDEKKQFLLSVIFGSISKGALTCVPHLVAQGCHLNMCIHIALMHCQAFNIHTNTSCVTSGFDLCFHCRLPLKVMYFLLWVPNQLRRAKVYILIYVQAIATHPVGLVSTWPLFLSLKAYLLDM